MRPHSKLTIARWAIIGIAGVAVIIAAAWYTGSVSTSPEVDPEIEARAERLRSEIQDYSPPELNVPDTSPKTDAVQTQSTKQPQRAN